jgi:murein DD-endopeptidase MepM/ murein hydrolase activator NlpD
MLSPVGADFELIAPAGSRFIGDTVPPWIWREHKGVDFGNGSTGAPVRATLEGKVTFELGGFGIEYKDELKRETWIAVYRHMPPSSFKFKVGEKVKVGDLIGEIGAYGSPGGPHMHYEVALKTTNPKNGRFEYQYFDPTMGYLLGDKK